MASTKESAPHHHHHTLVLGLIFIFITRISSQQETAINSTVSVMPSSDTSIPSIASTVVQNYSTNSETSQTTSVKEQVNDTTPSIVTTKISNNVTVTVTETPYKSLVVTTISSKDSCSGYNKLEDELQPKYSDFAKIKKCCPLGQNYHQSGGDRDKCDTTNVQFEAFVIEAVFYEHCIEDTEKPIKLDFKFGNPCGEHEALTYSKAYNDKLYVLQNGSLLRIGDDDEPFDIFEEYCLDMDRDYGYLTAIVCNQSLSTQHLVHVSKAQSYLYAICKYLFFV